MERKRFKANKNNSGWEARTPWERSDVPVNCWLREDENDDKAAVVVYICEEGIETHSCFASWKNLADHHQFSTDLKNWFPCTKEGLKDRDNQWFDVGSPRRHDWLCYEEPPNYDDMLLYLGDSYKSEDGLWYNTPLRGYPSQSEGRNHRVPNMLSDCGYEEVEINGNTVYIPKVDTDNQPRRRCRRNNRKKKEKNNK
jgi:hypothetical protein